MEKYNQFLKPFCWISQALRCKPFGLGYLINKWSNILYKSSVLMSCTPSGHGQVTYTVCLFIQHVWYITLCEWGWCTHEGILFSLVCLACLEQPTEVEWISYVCYITNHHDHNNFFLFLRSLFYDHNNWLGQNKIDSCFRFPYLTYSKPPISRIFYS